MAGQDKWRVVGITHEVADEFLCVWVEMALWRTLWMVDQVSLTAVGGSSASRNK